MKFGEEGLWAGGLAAFLFVEDFSTNRRGGVDKKGADTEGPHLDIYQLVALSFAVVGSGFSTKSPEKSTLELGNQTRMFDAFTRRCMRRQLSLEMKRNGTPSTGEIAQTPQVPPKPIFTWPRSTMTGTSLSPWVCSSISASADESFWTSLYSKAILRDA